MPFTPGHPQPGETFEIAGARPGVLPAVTRIVLAIGDTEETSIYLVEANGGDT